MAKRCWRERMYKENTCLKWMSEESKHVRISFQHWQLEFGEAYVDLALKNRKYRHFESSDRHRKQTPVNKTDTKTVHSVKAHIHFFSRALGHFTRLVAKRDNHVYIEDVNQLTYQCYHKIFNEEFNLWFHVLKKVQCNLCTWYHTAKNDDSLTEDLKQTYNQHQDRKLIAQEDKSKDKCLSKENTKVPKYILAYQICKLFFIHPAQ